MQIRTYDSPVAKLTVAVQNGKILAISFSDLDDVYLRSLLTKPAYEIKGLPADSLDEQLGIYFSGKDPHFNLDLEVHGTDFQKAVWTACAAIPYGETRTYGELAAMIGKPKAVRAVGTALGANPIPIVIPCHRVIGSKGQLTGFAGGLDIKKKLLVLEEGNK